MDLNDINELLKDEQTMNRVKKIIKENPKLLEKRNSVKVKKIKPNEPCPCNSGLKYKKCHFNK